MKQSLKKFKEFYLEQMLSFLWRQWSDLGVAGYGGNRESYAVDPEAMLIFSCTVARYEPRLFDEIINWLIINGNLINVQRLKKIINSGDFSGVNVLSAVAEFTAQRHKFLKWKGLIRQSKDESRETLFFLKDGNPMKQFGKEDATFFRHGFLRGKIELRGNLSPIKISSDNCLIAKLRFLFGINARSEIILYLLACEKTHPAKIARDIYYSQKTVQDTLVEMERSGLIRFTKSGREKRYWLDKGRWFNFLMRNGNLAGWINWPLLFNALEKIWLKLNRKSFLNLDYEMQSSELRALMREACPKIEEAGFCGIISDDKMYLGESYLTVFESDIKKLMTRL